MPGLYKKKINGVSVSDTLNVEAYFNFVECLVKKYLPKCLLRVFDTCLKEVGFEDLSQIKGYKDMKVINSKLDSFGMSQKCQKAINYTFMPSASFGSNNLLPLHTDEDMFLSIIHVYAKSDTCHNDNQSAYMLKSDVAKYFTFNDGTSIAMPSGDILVFNPTIPHCVSSNTDRYSHDEVFCVSHYFKSLIAGRNNNKIKFRN